MKEMQIVLMIDDNPADTDLVAEALRDCIGSSLSSVGDGEAAIAFLKRRGIHAQEARPDLIILDLNLPKKSGHTVLAELKADPDLKAIPVVVFSTSRLNSDIASSYELGANSYVNKPGNLTEFLAAVRAIEGFWFKTSSLPRGGKR